MVHQGREKTKKRKKNSPHENHMTDHVATLSTQNSNKKLRRENIKQHPKRMPYDRPCFDVSCFAI